MQPGCNGGASVNSFALVSYIPDPLGAFLDRLRNDLVCECHSKAHVTVLPPRPLFRPASEAWTQMQERLPDFQPFHVELGEIQVFPITDVIYLSVNAGHAELQKLHTALNTACLAFAEPFQYHPHVTLAQELDRDRLAEATELAKRRWHEFREARSFLVDKLTFVQNTLDNSWTDLNAWQLSSGVPSL
jgi:2'-5' RNA ligase